MSDEIIYKRSRIPDVYRQPMGLPLNWQDEASGELRSAVFKFFSYRKLSPDEISLVAEYCQHYINAPYWDASGGFPDELAALRQSTNSLSTVDDISQWINACLEIAIDPF